MTADRRIALWLTIPTAWILVLAVERNDWSHWVVVCILTASILVRWKRG